MAEALKSEGAEVTYIELAGVGHNAWDRAYGDAELWRWLFQQSVRRR
jgi:predicted peptidase